MNYDSVSGFPISSNSKESFCIAGDLDLIPGSGRSLEKSMANHSSILALRIPWTEEPDGLQFMGSQSQIQLKNFHMTLYQAIGLMILASFWLKNKRYLEDFFFFSYSSKKKFSKMISW